jgi:hypothetical protein
MIVKSDAPLYNCRLELVSGYRHLKQLIEEKKSVCFRTNREEIQIYPAAWFINLNYGYASYLIMNCVYVYDKEKIKAYGL